MSGPLVCVFIILIPKNLIKLDLKWKNILVHTICIDFWLFAYFVCVKV